MKIINPLITILLVFCLGCNQRNIKTIKVDINNNIETLAILYLISDVPLNIPEGSLSKEAKLHFSDFRNHEVIDYFKKIYELGFDVPVDFFLKLSKFPNTKLESSLDTIFIQAFEDEYNTEDFENFLESFIKTLNQFYIEAKIEEFIDDHKSYYEKCINDVKRNLPNDNFIPTMEKYYGKEFNSYNIIPSPILFPFIGFGSTIENQNEIDIYYVAGPFDEPDSTQEYMYGFNSPANIREMSVHEFGHSFVNPITQLPKNKQLINKFSYLYKPIKNQMKDMAYGSWESCVNEHLVRLGEIRIVLEMNDSLTANKIRMENIEQNKFIYLPYLENKVLEYENNRDKYHTFSDFFPELIDVFSEITWF